MMLMTIRLSIDMPHASSPHEQTKAAIEALAEVVRNATPETPALGGELSAAGEFGTRRRLGSYVVEFP